MSKGIFILLGSNLGDKIKNLEKAIGKMGNKGIVCTAQSSVYSTAAWGVETQPEFINQVVEVETDLSPSVLLETLLSIELEMGRVRKQKWGERLIDLDILYFNDLVLSNRQLTIPHPGIPDRRFTLVPLVEMNPAFLHPLLHKSNKELLLCCPDSLEVKVLK